jgi:Tol biopolymer transport system component
MLLCLVMVGNGVRPVSAQQAKPTARQVWTTSEPIAFASMPAVSPNGRFLSFTSWEAGGALAVRDLAKGVTRLLTPKNVSGTEGWAANKVISPDSRQVAYLWFTGARMPEVRVVPVDGSEPRTISKSLSPSDYIGPCGWTPDGKQLLAVQSLPDHSSRIVMLSVQDGSVRPLKSLKWEPLRTSLSPDGRYVAYDGPQDPQTGRRDIFVLATEGSLENTVVQNPANDLGPVWTADGSRIIFVSDRTGSLSLWSVPVQDGKAKGPAEWLKTDMSRSVPLGTGRNGALYYADLGGGVNIYTTELDADMRAAAQPALTTDRFVNSNMGPAWSPDGQQLAYYSGRAVGLALMVRTVRTGEEREIPVQVSVDALQVNGMAGPRWFPDGRSLLVFAREPSRPFGGFYRVEVASGKTELLHQLSHEIAVFAFAPDASAIFYFGLGHPLMRFDLETRHESDLTKGTFGALAVSPDSKQLAFLSIALPGNASILGTIPTAGGEPREIFRDAPWGDHNKWNALTWSADGKYLVFVRARGMALDAPAVLTRVAVTGGQPQPLGISLKGEIHNPQVSPDGRRIVFGASDPSPSEVWALENFLKKSPTGR